MPGARNHPAGSQWRKWDLHVHTPASYQWDGRRLNQLDDNQRQVVLKEMVDALNASDVAVFGFMDYWTFDGYLTLRNFLEENGNTVSCAKTLLPGVELRVEAAADYRLNIHALLSDQTTHQELSDFLGTLRIAFGGGIERPLSREALIQRARAFPDSVLATHGVRREASSDDEAMFAVGCKTAQITRQSFWDAVSAIRNKVLIIQPWSTYNGLAQMDWRKFPHDVYQFMQSADIFESRKDDEIDLFLAQQTPKNKRFIADFLQALGGRPKMVVSGSDAHNFGAYGTFPGGRPTWIKADPTFAGLQLAAHEPQTRSFVGEEPPKLRHVRQNPTRYIKALSISKNANTTLAEHWFDCSVEFNPGLIAIIGNKGSGKSALLDVLALLGNAHRQDMAFLTPERFRNPKTNKAEHFTAKLDWYDGSCRESSLDATFQPDMPERVRYLPQSYLERLCSEPDESGLEEFQNELEKVIFSHVDDETRFGHRTLRELLESRSRGIEDELGSARRQLGVLNQEIVETENELTEERERSLNNELALKRQELVAHEQAKPSSVAKPDDNGGQASNEQIESAENEAREVAEALAKVQRAITGEQRNLQMVDRLQKQLAAASSEFKATRQKLLPDLAALGLNVDDIIAIKVNEQPLAELRATSERNIARLRTDQGNDDTSGLRKQRLDVSARLDALRAQLAAPFVAYRKHLNDLAEWEAQRVALIGSAERVGTVGYLEEQLRKLRDVLPIRREELQKRRLEASERIFSLLGELQCAYREAYRPIQNFIDSHELAKAEMGLHFSVTLQPKDFADRFFQLIHQGRRGSFYGADEGRQVLQRMIEKAQFEDWEGTRTFLTDVVDRIRHDRRAQDGTEQTIESQLRRGTTVNQLYDLLYSLDWLTLRYSLRLGGKELRSLSPGERGALLLMFYMLLDQENVPLLIDQPEHNLDNESVFRLLVPCIKEVRERRQVFIVTHNPNLAVVCDAEQIVCAAIFKEHGYRVAYETGAIENPPRNSRAVEVLEGTWPAFSNRQKKYTSSSL